MQLALPFSAPNADTISYVQTASAPFWSTAFFAGYRPFIVPMFYKFTQADLATMAWVQVFFSAFAWGFLAYEATISIRNRWLQVFGQLLLLAFSLVYHISAWDVELLSESLSLSFLAIFIALIFSLLDSWSWVRAALVFVSALCWVFTRDSNAWAILSYAGVMGVIGLLYKAYRPWLYLAGCLTLLFFFNNLSVNAGARWQRNFYNVLPQRILVNKNAVRFFETCGMPVTPKLLKLSGPDVYSPSFLTDPELEHLQAWTNQRGKYCFLRWLVISPDWALSQPLKDWDYMLRFDPIRQLAYFPANFPRILPEGLEVLLYPAAYGSLVWWLGSLVAGFYLGYKQSRTKPILIVISILFLLTTPQMWFTWHADTMEIARHAFQSQCMIFLCSWLFVLYGMDEILLRRSKS